MSVEVLTDNLLQEIMEYQHPDLVRRLEEKLDLDQEEAAILFQDTKKFLYLCGMVPGRWSPTKQIDEGWHNFILFTKDYDEFCHRFFDRFIHHEPKRSGIPSHAIGLDETASAARQTFGDDLSGNWKIRDTENSGECSKSGCNCSSDTGGGGADCTPD